MPQFDYGKMLQTGEAIKSARTRNVLGEMQLEAEREKMAKESARNVLAQEFLGQGQPQVGMAGRGGEIMPPIEAPMEADQQGYIQALYGQGDIEGARAEEERGRQQETQALERVVKIMAISPKKGVKAWAEDPLLGGKHGPIEHMGVKENMQIYRDAATGEISGVNKKTGEVKILKEGGAPKEKPFEATTRELGARGKIESLVGKEMQAKYGKAGLKYDAIMGEWIFPPDFDQKTFWEDYNKRKKSYFKKFKLSPVEDTQENRPPIEGFFEG